MRSSISVALLGRLASALLAYFLIISSVFRAWQDKLDPD